MKHYLNNAGAGLLSNDTLDYMVEYYHYEQNQGAYQAAKNKKEDIELFYTNVANIINAESKDEIAYVDNASRGWNLAISSSNLSKGDIIVTLSSEFGTNLITLFDYAKKTGAEVKVIPCDITGHFDLSLMEKILRDAHSKKMIAISHAAAQGSIVNPVYEIGELAKEFDALYIVDACQSVGQIDIDVQKMMCHMLVASGRKWLCGPRGTGFMYIKKSTKLRPTQLDLASADLVFDNGNVIDIKVREDAKRFEIWERNISAMLGLSKAIDAALSTGIDLISKKIEENANRIREEIVRNSKLQLIGQKCSPSGIVGFYVKDTVFEKKVLDLISDNEVVISTMREWDCPMFFPNNGASCIFRISPHHYTTPSTIETICKVISLI